MPYIASGSYGCVFRPHIKCRNKKEYKGSVGKVFYTKEDADAEREIDDKVKEIDPSNKFSVPMFDACETDTDHRISDRVQKCKNIDMKSATFQQLIYKYGGKSLLDVLTKRKGNMTTFKKILRALLNILEGLARVNKMGYVHQDIKPDNILMGTSLANKTKDPNAYIIDFGILDKQDNIFKDENISMLKYDYPYFPPEYKLYVHKTNFNAFFKAYSDNFYYRFPFNGKKYYLMDHFTDLGIDMKKECKTIFNDPAFDAGKIDIYSFGIVLLMVYLWAGLPDVVEMKEFIVGLVHPNPAIRYSYDVALERYKAVLAELKIKL